MGSRCGRVVGPKGSAASHPTVHRPKLNLSSCVAVGIRNSFVEYGPNWLRPQHNPSQFAWIQPGPGSPVISVEDRIDRTGALELEEARIRADLDKPVEE